MRLLIQRVSHAQVSLDGKLHSSINQGLLVLIGFCHSDTEALIPRLAQKLCELRIFSDSNGKLNLSVQDVKGGILLVSQFTLYADCRRGRRPDFIQAAEPKLAEELYNQFIKELAKYQAEVRTGVFAADMQVTLTNDGPVTIMLDSDIL
jgi:D-tyrosyl-tRNA(Tyr) deacylase